MAIEKRLIDANYLVNKGIRNCPIEEGGIPLGDFAQHQKILELYPTVDAVEVVRCDECVHYEEPEEGDFLGRCTSGILAVSNNGEIYPGRGFYCLYGEIYPGRGFYCLYGERKTNG